MEILNEIEKTITWYKGNCNSADINNLLHARDRLATNSFFLASLAADLKIQYNADYFARKISILNDEQGFIMTMSAAKAKIEAEYKNQEVLKREIESQGMAYKCDILLKQVNKTLDAMSQRIATLKEEMKSNTQSVIE